MKTEVSGVPFQKITDAVTIRKNKPDIIGKDEVGSSNLPSSSKKSS